MIQTVKSPQSRVCEGAGAPHCVIGLAKSACTRSLTVAALSVWAWLVQAVRRPSRSTVVLPFTR